MDIVTRYLSVTPEDIRSVAATVFRADNRLVLTYLPEGAEAAGDASEEGAA